MSVSNGMVRTAPSKLEQIGEVIGRARELAREYKRLTGKPLGITGEVAEFEAARLLHLKKRPRILNAARTLAEARTPGYDALRGEERLQIKGRVIAKDAKPGQRLGSIRLDHGWEAVLLVVLDEDLQVSEIWETSRAAVKTALAKPGSKARNVRGALAVNSFKRMGSRLWPETMPPTADSMAKIGAAR